VAAEDELLPQGGLEVVDDVFAADDVVHFGGKQARGTAVVPRFVRQPRAAFPDVCHDAIRDSHVHGDDRGAGHAARIYSGGSSSTPRPASIRRPTRVSSAHTSGPKESGG
jgi:hypothetical protein